MKTTCILVAFAATGTQVMAQNTGGFFFGPSAEKSEGSCKDNKGQMIPEGLLFTPGPDECQVCTCLRKMPVLCRTVLCAPPKNCLSLRVVDACCQWICDDWESPPGSFSDIGLRLVASAVTAILSLSLLVFLIYRLRQRRLRSRQNHLQAERFSSDAGPSDDCWVGDTQLSSFGSFLGWRKPLDSTFQRPFPPTYDEAVSYASTMETVLDPVTPAPPYHSHAADPAVPYQVATLGRRVLPVGVDATRTLPAALRRINRQNSPSLTEVHQESRERRSTADSIWTSTSRLEGRTHIEEAESSQMESPASRETNQSMSHGTDPERSTHISHDAGKLLSSRGGGETDGSAAESAGPDVTEDPPENPASTNILNNSTGFSRCHGSGKFTSPTHV